MSLAAALKQLQDYANGVTIAVPTLSTYSNLGLRDSSGRPLVTNSNLASINSVLASAAVTSGQIPDAAAVQVLVETYNVVLSWANGSFADVGTAPQASDYRRLGVSMGAWVDTANNLTLFNAIVGARTRSQVDTIPELQALANATIKIQGVIAGTWSEAPLTVADLQLVGLTGITTLNLAFVANALAAQPDDGSATLSLNALQTVANRAVAARAAIVAYANNDDGNQTTFPPPTRAQYADAGLTLTDAQITALNSALKTATIIGSRADTPAELMAIKDVLDKVQAIAGNSSSTSILSKSELAIIGIVVDDMSYTVGGTTVTSDIAGLVTQAFKAKSDLTLPTVQDMERWVDVIERVMKLVATGDTGASTLTLQELKDFGLVPAQVTGPTTSVLDAMVHGFDAGTGIKDQDYNTLSALKEGIEAALIPVVTVTALDNGTNSAFDTGFSVRTGANVTVRVNGAILDNEALSAKFTKATASDLDTYTAKAGAFVGTEEIRVDATYVANGLTGKAAQLTLQPIDTSAPAAPLNIELSLDSTDGAAGNDRDGVTANGNLAKPTHIEEGATVEYRITKNESQGQWQNSYTAPQSDGTADGQYSIEVRQKDRAGNIGDAQTVRFTLDSIAPSVALTAVADSNDNPDAVYNEGFSATAGASITVKINGATVTLLDYFDKNTANGLDTYSGQGKGRRQRIDLAQV